MLLSFDWDDEALLMATPTDNPTGRNLAATRAVRLGLGHTRDVSMVEGEVEVFEIDALTKENQTYCSKLVRSSQATPTEIAPAAPPNRWRHDEHGHEDGHAVICVAHCRQP